MEEKTGTHVGGYNKISLVQPSTDPSVTYDDPLWRGAPHLFSRNDVIAQHNVQASRCAAQDLKVPPVVVWAVDMPERGAAPLSLLTRTMLPHFRPKCQTVQPGVLLLYPGQKLRVQAFAKQSSVTGLVNGATATLVQVGVSEIIGQREGGAVQGLVDILKDESEPFRQMAMSAIEKIILNLGASDVDSRLEEALNDGILYAGNSRIIADGAPGSSFLLNSHAKQNTPAIPAAYTPVRIPAFIGAGTALPGTSAAISSRYTGNRAEHAASGATRIVINLSRGLSIVRAAITPGTAHACDPRIGRKLFPVNPTRLMIRSIRNATRAM